MIIRSFDRTQTASQDMVALLELFRNSTSKDDYMAIGEITDQETLEKILYNKNLIHFFGYEGGSPVAYCQVVYKSDSVNFHSGAKIQALSVLPERRGQGLGTALLSEVVATLQKNTRIKNIHLEVVKENSVAVSLYKKLGFEKTGELKSMFTKHGALLDIEMYSLLVNR